jgi:hypothetical protein
VAAPLNPKRVIHKLFKSADGVAAERRSALDASFATILWSIIIVTDIALALARMFMAPGTLRLSFALAIPVLILLGALINAVYNRITSGHALDAPPRRKVSRP